MQRKLRLRFMIISWVLLFLLLIAACIGISVYMYQSSVNDTEKSLQDSVEVWGFPDSTRGMIGVMTDDHGIPRMYACSHINVTVDTVRALTKQIAPKGKEQTGVIYYEGVKYRYLAVPENNGARCALAECSAEQELVRTLKRNSIIVAVLGVFLLIPVCAMLSK